MECGSGPVVTPTYPWPYTSGQSAEAEGNGAPGKSGSLAVVAKVVVSVEDKHKGLSGYLHAR